jgi:hypothetical protein
MREFLAFGELLHFLQLIVKPCVGVNRDLGAVVGRRLGLESPVVETDHRVGNLRAPFGDRAFLYSGAVEQLAGCDEREFLGRLEPELVYCEIREGVAGDVEFREPAGTVADIEVAFPRVFNQVFSGIFDFPNVFFAFRQPAPVKPRDYPSLFSAAVSFLKFAYRCVGVLQYLGMQVALR